MDHPTTTLRPADSQAMAPLYAVKKRACQRHGLFLLQYSTSFPRAGSYPQASTPEGGRALRQLEPSQLHF